MCTPPLGNPHQGVYYPMGIPHWGVGIPHWEFPTAQCAPPSGESPDGRVHSARDESSPTWECAVHPFRIPTSERGVCTRPMGSPPLGTVHSQMEIPSGECAFPQWRVHTGERAQPQRRTPTEECAPSGDPHRGMYTPPLRSPHWGVFTFLKKGDHTDECTLSTGECPHWECTPPMETAH